MLKENFFFIGSPGLTRRGFTEQIGGEVGRARACAKQFGPTGLKKKKIAASTRARLENIG